MILRKGQKLIGIVSLKLQDLEIEATPSNIENYIWNMTSTEFDEIMNTKDESN